MSDSRPASIYPNRRMERRLTLPADAETILRFRFPSPHGQEIEAKLRDISLSGLSMALPEPLHGVEPGDIVKGIEVRVARKTFRGDLLIMHLSPWDHSPPICGGLFYPEGDEDLITIRLVVRALEAASPEIS